MPAASEQRRSWRSAQQKQEYGGVTGPPFRLLWLGLWEKGSGKSSCAGEPLKAGDNEV